MGAGQSPGNGFDELTARGVIGHRVTLATLARFYLARPARLWRHVHSLLPTALTLRTHYGNFKISAGYPPMTRSGAFSLWSGVHRRVLSPLAKWILFSFLLPAVMLLTKRSWSDRIMRSLALLGIAGFISFLTVAFGDALDNVKHFLLFNLIADAFLISSAMVLFQAIASKRRASSPDDAGNSYGGAQTIWRGHEVDLSHAADLKASRPSQPPASARVEYRSILRAAAAWF